MKLAEDVKFKNAVKENKRRINIYYEKRIENFKILTDSSQPINLHDGFNKICGLRGSLLSGGQK